MRFSSSVPINERRTHIKFRCVYSDRRRASGRNSIHRPIIADTLRCMRGALVLGLCVGCGRVGFQGEALPDADLSANDAVADGPPPVIAAVQAVGSSSSTAVNSVALPAQVQAQDAIIACFTFRSGSATLQSITDSLGNSYAVVVGPVLTNGYVHYVAIASRSPGGNETVTVTLSAPDSNGWDLLALEYTGLALTDVFDVSSFSSGNSGDMSSGAVSTSSPHELVLAYGHSTGQIPGSGYTVRDALPDDMVEDQVVFTAGSYTATGTTIPGIWTLILATFAGR